MEKARLQVQDVTGQWITVQTVPAQDQIVFKSIDSLSRQYKKLVRAVDSSGNILQLKGF